MALAMPLSAGSPGVEPPPVATFSIVAIDPTKGDLGVAVASRDFSVGSVVPWAMAGVGAVATQANVNVGYGQQAIDLLRQGLTAQQVLARLLADDTFSGKDGRQVAIVDAKGNALAFLEISRTPQTSSYNRLRGTRTGGHMGRAISPDRGDRPA